MRAKTLDDDAGVFLDTGYPFVQFRTVGRELALTIPGFLSTVRGMTDDRISGLALIVGSIGVIVTLALHPSGRELFVPGQFESAARKLIVVHSLALVSLPVWFFGACGLSRRLGYRLGVAPLVIYGFGLMAMMNALVIDGLVSPGLAREIVATTGTVGQGWRIAFNHNSIVDQAFMHVFLAASSVAILLWSVSILKSGALARGVGIYGCILGAAAVIALLSGQLDRHEHFFGVVIIGQAIWFFCAGVLLCQIRDVGASV